MNKPEYVDFSALITDLVTVLKTDQAVANMIAEAYKNHPGDARLAPSKWSIIKLRRGERRQPGHHLGRALEWLHSEVIEGGVEDCKPL